MGHAQTLEQLRYNHPGLTVDLGVGLWAWPVPYDVDRDSDNDLLVSCPDKPSNGVWLFENRQVATQSNERSERGEAANKLPIFEPARRLSNTVHYITPSYVDGKLRVMSPGAEYLNFETEGTKRRHVMPMKSDFYKPQGTQTEGPKVAAQPMALCGLRRGRRARLGRGYRRLERLRMGRRLELTGRVD